MFWGKKNEVTQSKEIKAITRTDIEKEGINKVIKEWLDFSLSKEVKGFSDLESMLEWLNATRYQLVSHINSNSNDIQYCYFDLATLCMHAVNSIVRDHFASEEQFESIMLETAGYHHQLLDRLETRQKNRGLEAYNSHQESLGYIDLALFNVEQAILEKEYGIVMNNLMDMAIECVWAESSKQAKD
jgi:hypothetical protein